MFTIEQANDFLTTRLNFLNWEKVLETNKLDFLTIFVRKHVTHIPYQNITLSSVNPEKRHYPTHEEFIVNGITGKGGVCIDLNHFAKVVLDTIGFDTYAVQGNCIFTEWPGDHYIVVVKLNGEQYLIDVGEFSPVYDVIPLDPAKLPFRSNMFGFPYEYSYAKATDMYTRTHLVGGCHSGRFKDKDESIFMQFNLTPKKLEDCHETMTKIFSDPSSHLLATLFLSRFLEVSDEEMKNKDANPGFVYIIKTKLVVGDRDSRNEIVFETHDQLIPSIIKYFPELSPEEIERAIDTYPELAENNP